MPEKNYFPESIHLTFLDGINWPLPVQIDFNPEEIRGIRGEEFTLEDKDLVRFRSCARTVFTARGIYVRVLHESAGCSSNRLENERIPSHLEYLKHILGNHPIPVIELRYERVKEDFPRDIPDRPGILQ